MSDEQQDEAEEKKTIDVWLSAEDAEKLREIAADKGISPEELAGQMLNYGLDHFIEVLARWYADPKRGPKN